MLKHYGHSHIHEIRKYEQTFKSIKDKLLGDDIQIAIPMFGEIA